MWFLLLVRVMVGERLSLYTFLICVKIVVDFFGLGGGIFIRFNFKMEVFV